MARHTGSVNLHQLSNQLLQLVVLESRQRRTLGTAVETLAIAIRAEQAQLAVVATVHLHALEALGGVVKDGRSRRDAEVLVGLDLRSLPTAGSSPPHGNHVVSAVGVAHLLRRARQRNITQVGGAGDVEVGAIKLGHIRRDGTHRGWLSSR